MFADRLTPEQRAAIFELALILAAADDEISEEELDYLRQFSQAYGITFHEEPQPESEIDDLLVPFETRQSKMILLQELIKLSYKDGHFGKEEQSQVFAIAQKIGLNDPELLMRVEKWVREGFDWLYEGELMLQGG